MYIAERAQERAKLDRRYPELNHHPLTQSHGEIEPIRSREGKVAENEEFFFGDALQYRSVKPVQQ